METKSVYCPACNHQVGLIVTQEHRAGHANLPEGVEVVCLDFGQGCAHGRCPLTGTRGIVMAVRLARSHLRDEAFQTVTARCDACECVAEMEVLDDTHAFCPICQSTQQWVMFQVDPQTRIVIANR